VLSGSTKENVVFFSSLGSAYVTRIHDIPPSTGYGDPVQKLFKFKDGERVVSALSLDARLTRPQNLLAVTRKGYGLRFALTAHTELSTRAGRRFARVGEGDEIAGVFPAEDKDYCCVCTEKGHVLVCPAGEINLLANPGRGVTVIKVLPGDRVIGFGVARGKHELGLTVETAGGKTIEIGAGTRQVTARGGKGVQAARGTTVKQVPPPVRVTTFTPPEVN
jgi:DNA gyrase subunit A